jgi:Carboxypeptidase regulatory-like domain
VNTPGSRRRFGFGISFLLIPAFCFALLLSSIPLRAQVEYGVNGTVTDATGAVVSGARVTVTNNTTGIVSKAITSPAGAYTVILLNPGIYTVAVAAPGFEASVNANVIVEVGKFSAVSSIMVPGSASQTVTVSGQTVSLNTEDPGIGTTLEPALVDAAPIEVSGGPRQINSFVLQAPGTGAPGNIGAEGGSLNISGGITAESNYYYDGIPVTEPESSGYSEIGNAYPPYEMVSEFRVASSTFSAQYGLAQGVITYKMATGTNRYHGDVFDILRNSLFDSAGFFPSNFNANGTPAPPVNHQNDFGFSLGGPASIPKVYDAKNRTFFFFSLDWYHQHEGQTAFGAVPTAAEKTGDFSSYVDSNGNQIPIYDPQTGLPFPGNVIPQSRFSPISSSLIPLIPNPDRTGTVFGQQANKTPAVASLSNLNHLWGFTLNHNLTAAQRINFSFWNTYANNPGAGRNIVPFSNELQSGSNNSTTGTGYLLSYLNTVTPNLVVTAGIAKIDVDYGISDALQGTGFAGVTGSNSFPSIAFDGQNAISQWGNSETEVSTRQIDLAFVNNWLWTKGRHTFNIGGELRRTYENSISCTVCGASLQFTQRTTSTPNASDPNFGSYGSSFASFLLGQVDSVDREFAEPTNLRNLAFSTYIQDDYKVNSRLTVNAGLRWDIPVPFNAVGNNITFADLTAPNAQAGGLLGTLSKFGVCAAGCVGVNRAAIHWKDFGPRLGFSYMADKKTVVQGGFYLAYLQGGAYSFGTTRIAQQYTGLLAGSYTAGSTGTSNPGYGSWDAKPVPYPSATPFSPFLGNGNFVRQLNLKTSGMAPYNQSWSFDVQRELPWDMFLMLAYIGNRDIHLPSSLNQPNQLNPKYLALGNLLGELVTSQDAINAGIQIPYANFLNDFGSNAVVEQALLPYPQYSGTDNHFDQTGSSFYNAFVIQAEKRFTNNLSYLANFTLGLNKASVDYGVTLQQNNPVNTYNQGLEWAASILNQKYAAKFVATYKLPLGYGQRFLNSKGWLADVIGGWQVAGIMDYYAGNPIGLSENNVVLMATNANGDGVNRPDIVPGVKRKTYSYNLTKQFFKGEVASQPVQFSTNAFTPSPQYGLGNTSRNYTSITSAPLAMESFDASKSFRLGEWATATVRVDYFNAFNRTQIEPPDNDISDSTFGQVTSQGSQISNRQGQATFKVTF